MAFDPVCPHARDLGPIDRRSTRPHDKTALEISQCGDIRRSVAKAPLCRHIVQGIRANEPAA
jgi:hypothetical protein